MLGRLPLERDCVIWLTVRLWKSELLGVMPAVQVFQLTRLPLSFRSAVNVPT